MEVVEASNQQLRNRRPDALGNLCVLPDEILCSILVYLTPRDVARLACVSSVMYILCNEDPLWMSLCLNANHQIQYKGSWKRTTLHQLDLCNGYEETCKKSPHFDGFNSLFLYKRFYRCHTNLHGFSFDNGNVDRKKDLSLEEFHDEYDGKRPVLISGLADDWPARDSWTIEQLLLKYGDTAFRISQRSSQKISMKFKDYVTYMQLQHDEDPLYIFDDRFGEVVPSLLKDYSVPHLFQEDLFDVLDRDKRPPFRWLIIGPERSGASWHVDPALTSAWNTLLCGCKRWALYPPGRVPLGVTVHVDEEDGDVNIETPYSLQWWLDFYPLLADEDKPIECTQLPGETIFVPSGWWHCVLNIEPTVAVTQNFVNSKNIEYVCLDMAPGYRHKGVCRAGLLAIHDGILEEATNMTSSMGDSLSYSDLTRKKKRMRICRQIDGLNCEDDENAASESSSFYSQKFVYDINFLASFLDSERDHFNSLWCSSNCIGQREMREWLSKLWVGKPGLRDVIWKGACLSLNAGKWSQCMEKICAFHELPSPTDDEKLPVGTGSNPVYLVSDNVIKIFVEDGLEACLHSLGTELQFYDLLNKVESPLKNHIPNVLASGILFLENGSYRVMPWDGRGVPEVIGTNELILENCNEADYPFGIWSKKQFEYKKSGISAYESISSSGCSHIWPYIITKRCRGMIFAELRETLTWEEILNLASFLGEQLRNLHLLPCPSFQNSTFQLPCNNGLQEDVMDKVHIQPEWEIFIRTLNRQKESVCSRLTKWGDPIPDKLIDKVDEYIPDNFEKLITMSEDVNGLMEGCKSCTWIHSDIMDDNIHMEPFCTGLCSGNHISDTGFMGNSNVNGSNESGGEKSWRPSHILDFGNLSIGDPICDLIPLHLDIFRGDCRLLKQFLGSYKLPLVRRKLMNDSARRDGKFERLSYLAMCYCILHEENILGAIFGLWKELRTAKSWEEVEETVWGDLNTYTSFN